MNHVVFYRETNDFTDILSDPVIKKTIKVKIRYHQHLILKLSDDKNTAYMMVKYGDDVINQSHLVPDRSPVPFKDYAPVRKDKKSK